MIKYSYIVVTKVNLLNIRILKLRYFIISLEKIHKQMKVTEHKPLNQEAFTRSNTEAVNSIRSLPKPLYTLRDVELSYKMFVNQGNIEQVKHNSAYPAPDPVRSGPHLIAKYTDIPFALHPLRATQPTKINSQLFRLVLIN